MRVDAIIRRWIEVLAGLVIAWRAHMRQQRSVIVALENGTLVVRPGQGDRDAIIRESQSVEAPIGEGHLTGTGEPSDLGQAAKNSSGWNRWRLMPMVIWLVRLPSDQ